jgi:single-stranded DNA-binding protein
VILKKRRNKMAGINKVIIVGNLGGDPELKEIGAGKYVCNFSVASEIPQTLL